ncbi:aldehyde dehydrogenase (nad+) [Fusarium heterosporum]|uniref:aldehyde dehydrogenase (NAD(+)) n=1 Tax=Fusarium heterosporum TaxID=42747 RepID=A0A8H5T8F9_FUSHE|nr:aldehyde dehydrogenase (nad+) [Fusarium heterosporum]
MTTNGTKALDLKDNYVQIINGKSAPTQKTHRGINPANLQEKPPVPIATKEDLDRAVDAARKAFKSWSKVPWEERKKKIIAWGDAVQAQKQDFADLLLSEQGKPIPQASGEVDAAVAWIQGQASIDLPEEVVEDSDTRKIVTRYTPLGVAAAIVPWNFPLMLAAAKIAPALLTGNVIIVKPSPFTPYCGLKLVELAQQFFPPGVVQSLSGDDNLGPWITAHPGIDKISFTGSTHTGKLVMQSAAKTLKRVTLELGGNDAAVVFPDVDIDSVAGKVAGLAFLNSGQICLNVKRVYVHESIYDKFRDAVVKHVKNYQVGDGSKENTSHGPIQNEMQYNRVKTFFDDIEKQGWKVAAGGKIDPSPKDGYYITPTVIDNPPDNSRIVVEEPFGPIMPLLSWKDEDEVIERANDTRLGLGASVWSANLETAERVAKSLDAGMVWVNNHFDITPMAPFGGHKESGIGAEWGVNGLKGFCNVQSLFFNKVPA